MSGPMMPMHNPMQPIQHTFHTPLQNFQAKFDHLHEHHFPNSHPGHQYGAKYNQFDLDTGKRMRLDPPTSFEININPPF